MIKLIKYFRLPTFSLGDWLWNSPTLENGEIGFIRDDLSSDIIGAKIGNATDDFANLSLFGNRTMVQAITLNASGLAGSSWNNAGLKIEENNGVVGHFLVNEDGYGFSFRAPEAGFIGDFDFGYLSSDRYYILPDQDGTIALLENSLSNVLTNGQIWVGNSSNVAAGVTMSGDGTISNAGVLTINNISLTTKVTGILPVANGGTGTSTAFTSGRIIYAGASGIYSQDTGLNWDATNNVLKIGPSPNELSIHAGNNTTTGNAFIGKSVGNYSLTGNYNIVLGESSGTALTSGATNTLIGYSTGTNLTTGYSNIFIGTYTGSQIINGAENTVIGHVAFQNASNGSLNVILGKGAGFQTSALTSLTALDNSILIGPESKPLTNSDTNEIVIGYQAVGYGSNTAVLGNSSITNTYLRGTLNLLTAPVSAPTETKLLVVDSSGVVKYRDSSTIVAAGSGHTIYNGASALTQRANLTFTNGLTAADNTTETLAKLGGALTENTNITGSSYYLNLAPGNVSLFGSSPSFGGGTGVMYMRVATTPPSSVPSSGIFIWVELVNGNYELRVMDSSGNIKGLS